MKLFTLYEADLRLIVFPLSVIVHFMRTKSEFKFFFLFSPNGIPSVRWQLLDKISFRSLWSQGWLNSNILSPSKSTCLRPIIFSTEDDTNEMWPSEVRTKRKAFKTWEGPSRSISSIIGILKNLSVNWKWRGRQNNSISIRMRQHNVS